MSCPRCQHEVELWFADDPAGYVRCGKCRYMYVPVDGPTSHDTLKEINDRLARIEMMLGIQPALVLDTQEQRKAKGAKVCPDCGVYEATETEGE